MSNSRTEHFTLDELKQLISSIPIIELDLADQNYINDGDMPLSLYKLLKADSSGWDFISYHSQDYVYSGKFDIKVYFTLVGVTSPEQSLLTVLEINFTSQGNSPDVTLDLYKNIHILVFDEEEKLIKETTLPEEGEGLILLPRIKVKIMLSFKD